jgi:hypothetical protein
MTQPIAYVSWPVRRIKSRIAIAFVQHRLSNARSRYVVITTGFAERLTATRRPAIFADGSSAFGAFSDGPI